MENRHSRLMDRLILVAGIIIFLALLGGTIREYREYLFGVEKVKRLSVNVGELQGRKERLQKLVEESKDPEFVEKQLKEKLGVGEIGAESLAVPTTEPRLIDLRMEEPRPKKVYWGEWWRLFF